MTHYVIAEFHMEGMEPRLSYLGELVLAKHTNIHNAEAEYRVVSRDWPRIVREMRDRLQYEYERTVFVRFDIRHMG